MANEITDDVFERLSSREKQIALLLASGKRNMEVAKALRISMKTVDTHRAHILAKLQCPNNVLLAHLAIARGWIPLLEITSS